jgi:hypothetical protein
MSFVIQRASELPNGKYQLLKDEHVQHFFKSAIRGPVPMESSDWQELYETAASSVRDHIYYAHPPKHSY